MKTHCNWRRKMSWLIRRQYVHVKVALQFSSSIGQFRPSDIFSGLSKNIRRSQLDLCKGNSGILILLKTNGNSRKMYRKFDEVLLNQIIGHVIILSCINLSKCSLNIFLNLYEYLNTNQISGAIPYTFTQPSMNS